MKPHAGMTIDGFELIEKMPSGGMASLWRARHPAHDFPIVLKMPFFDPGAEVSVIISHEMEEMIMRHLSGPHVPRFLGSGDLARTPYVAMEFVEGRHLAALAREAPLAAEEIAGIGIEVGTALNAIHRQKVVHLDLKPENVILAERGAVLLDFGLATHADLPDLLGAETELPIGTPAYIAPEQILGERFDPASDIFALGCILYLLATGKEPFGHPSTVAGMKRRLYQAPAPPRARNATLPQWLDAVIMRCLELDRSKRYADAAQVAFDLRNPDQVALPRQQEAVSPGLLQGLAGLFRKTDERALVGSSSVPRREAGPSMVLVAVDLSSGPDPLAQEVLAETARVLACRPDSKLVCLTVLKTEIVSETPLADESGRSIYLKRLVALKDWARPLHLPDERISFHVLEAVSPADAILAFAARNDAGHIVIGARASSALRRHLGSVSAKVVAEARCSVSVVRLKAVEERAATPLPEPGNP